MPSIPGSVTVAVPAPLSPRRLLRESAPVAAILLLWTIPSWVATGSVFAAGFRYAGVVMALLYVVVRGVGLGRSLPADHSPGDLDSLLRENLAVAFPAAAWFLAALVVEAIEPVWRLVGLPGLLTSPAGALSFSLAGTGVLTVLLYAVAVGSARLRDVAPPGESGADASPGDD